MKKLELLLGDAVVERWDNWERTAWLREPEEHAPPALYYYDLRECRLTRREALERLQGVSVQE